MTAKGRDVVRGDKESVAGLGGLSWPVRFLPFNFCCSVYTLCLVGMSVPVFVVLSMRLEVSLNGFSVPSKL